MNYADNFPTLSTEECATLLRCTPEHLQRLARQKVLPATKVGRDWIFVTEDILAWLRKRSAPTPTTPTPARGRPRRTVV